MSILIIYQSFIDIHQSWCLSFSHVIGSSNICNFSCSQTLPEQDSLLLRLFRLARLVFHLRLSFLGQLGITECMRVRDWQILPIPYSYREQEGGGGGRVFREAAQIEKWMNWERERGSIYRSGLKLWVLWVNSDGVLGVMSYLGVSLLEELL